MLTIEKVSKRFRAGNYGVRDLSLEVKSGVIGLLGPNGAGKTTLMQMIATITRPTSGRILFHGEDVVKRPNKLRRKLGYLPQDFGVYDNLTATEFLTYFAAALESTGTSAAIAGLVVATYGVAVLVFTQIVKRVASRVPPWVPISVGGAMAVIGYLVAALDQHLVAILLASVLIGGCYSFMHSTLQAWATDIAPEVRGTAASLFVACAFTGGAIGSAFGWYAHVRRTLRRSGPGKRCRIVIASAIAWQGWSSGDSRLMTGTPEYFANPFSTGSRRSCS